MNAIALTLFACDDDGGSTTDTGSDARDEIGADDTSSDARDEIGAGDTGSPDVSTIDQPTVDSTPTDTTPDVVTDCGSVTFFGECQGSIIRYCDCDPSGPDGVECTNGEIVETDCAETLLGTGVCMIVSDAFGAVCALSPGDPCLAPDDEGTEITGYCFGNDAGCVLGPDGDVCRENVGTCTGDEEEGVCNGDNLLLYCNETQPVSFDCAQFSGTCDAEADACVDLPEGSACGEGLECGDGLTCEGATEEEPGSCVADEGTGEGSGG